MAMTFQMVTMLLVAMLIGGPLAPHQDHISKLTTDDIASGKQLFVGHCALCHGIEGTGDRGPALDQPKLRRAADEQALFLLIKNGLPGTEMPDAWQMTDREIWQVARYVRSLGRTTAIMLPGNAANGKTIFDSKGGCTACHITQGRGGSLGPDLSDIGARRSAAYLREALTDPGKAAPAGFLVVTIEPRGGQTLRGIRVNEDSFTIQIRDATNRFHSFRKSDLAELKKESGKSLMPGYKDALASSEMDDLVAYLASLRGEQ